MRHAKNAMPAATAVNVITRKETKKMTMMNSRRTKISPKEIFVNYNVCAFRDFNGKIPII